MKGFTLSKREQKRLNTWIKESERAERAAEHARLKRYRATEHLRIFADCQGEPCPKRQGRGNHYSDIGLYK